METFKRIEKRLEVHFEKKSPETDEPCLLYANQRHIFVQGELKLVIQTDFMSRLDAGLASPFFTSRMPYFRDWFLLKMIQRFDWLLDTFAFIDLAIHKRNRE